MKKLITIIGICILIITLNACKKTEKENDELSSNENTVKVEKDWETLDKSEYSIEYPKNWTVDESGTEGTVFMLTSPSDSDTDKVTQSVNTVIENLPNDNIDLDAYVKAAINQVKTVYPNILKKEKMKSDTGDDFYKVVFSGKKEEMNQYYHIKNKKAYILKPFSFSGVKNSIT
ncbi:MAG: hypothetical protein L3J20_14040 [Flavobacteriaceae bacterium]|nr:hypothetical protein [Flavobacteriaceae bacterium]